MDTCPHCGGPMEASVALVNFGGHCERIAMPPHCPSADCREARDTSILEDLVNRGVIDR